MLFNSIQFLFFFPIVFLLYWMLPHKYRWIMLLIASCYFYMSFIPIYISILALTILIDYFGGRMIERSQEKFKKVYLIISIVSTCTVLFVFKYFNFFNSNVMALANFLHWNYPVEGLKLILPIGLSFHTFQSLSYVIEVYRGKQKAEKNFGIYSLYVMFYPQLVAGPIERPQNLLHQFHEKHEFSYQNVVSGLQLMLWGFFKKVVIADRLSSAVNAAYNNPSGMSGLTLIIATVLFTFQIYCDFSGYSDIAIGVAKTMGFDLMKNFNKPYLSKSIKEFWTRWHISLSTWFRDYVYIPLGGNRVENSKIYLNILIVFLLSGLWHGASWTFVLWGLLHGIYMIIGQSTKKFRGEIYNKLNVDPRILPVAILKVLITFSLICFSWIFFRANSLGDLVLILQKMVMNTNLSLSSLKEACISIGILKIQSLAMIGVLIIFMEIVHSMELDGNPLKILYRIPRFARWAFYYAILFAMIFWQSQSQEFIYFQF